jgi:hypothetical protein
MALVSCSQTEWEQEIAGMGTDEISTRSELIEYTIHVDTAGTLDSLVNEGSYSDAQKLIVTGDICYEDVHYVNVNMPAVEVLDLSGAAYDSESIVGAFLSDSTQIKEISLPGNITYISYKYSYNEDGQSWGYVYPFNCSSVTSIILPESLTEIGSYAFYNCSSLISIDIPESVTSFGYGAFWRCSSLTSVKLPEGLTSIGVDTFRYCTSLTSINIPEGVTKLEYCVFNVCTSLTSITLPESLVSIGDNAFLACTSLNSINIPESVTSIGYSAFRQCWSLTSINIPESVKSIGYEAFRYCTSLTDINIPKGISSIENQTFYDCRSLTNIDIPESVTSIGDEAFYGCSSLTNITIPENIKSIGDFAFGNCRSLQKLICNALADDIGDLSSSSNVYCWLIINRPDGNIPQYGPNWKNVVINGVADNVTLPYQKSVDFTIPEEVKSIKKISYTMNFGANYSGSYGTWRTIALPFTPTSITHAEKGTLAPFRSGVEGATNFWLRELTAEGFKNVTQIEANHPYLIAMPNSREYADKYNIIGDVTFSAENLTAEDFVNCNTAPLSAEGSDYTMYASYSYMSSTDSVYVLDYYNQFRSNWRSVYPFEAYLKANTSTLRSVISLNTGRAATRAVGEGKREPQIDDM